MSNGSRCAHQNIGYWRTELYPGRVTGEGWRCASCSTEFIPITATLLDVAKMIVPTLEAREAAAFRAMAENLWGFGSFADKIEVTDRDGDLMGIGATPLEAVEAAMAGQAKPVAKAKCPRCGGTGLLCGNTGKIWDDCDCGLCERGPIVAGATQTCPGCNGTGEPAGGAAENNHATS